MKTERPIRVLIDPRSNPGSWNMAVDEALLDSALKNGQNTVRIYRWKEATLSLGYFQDPADIADDPLLSKLPKVRRLSGGGAIVHHHEVTYSVTLTADHFAVTNPASIYRLVHAAVIEWLRNQHVHATLRGPLRETSVGKNEPFLCFSRGDHHDILLAGHKILGSAQRRRRGAVLQHGSLVLRSSQFAPHLPGLVDLAGEVDFDESGCDETYADVVSSPLGKTLIRGDLTPDEHALAQHFERERYLSVKSKRSRR